MKKYQAFTLTEMLVVMSIFMILSAMGISSFFGLHNTVKMNEYMMTLEQDIRAVQRASMLLEKNPMENWIYGLGIDFTNIAEDGSYTPFKWCTTFTDYGDPTTRSIVPAYDSDNDVDGPAPLPKVILGIPSDTMCSSIELDNHLRTLAGYGTNLTTPRSTVEFKSDARYVLFESVSGRAFFYNEAGELLNYEEDVVEGVWKIKDSSEIQHLEFVITPTGQGGARSLKILHLSGRIVNQFGD